MDHAGRLMEHGAEKGEEGRKRGRDAGERERARPGPTHGLCWCLHAAKGPRLRLQLTLSSERKTLLPRVSCCVEAAYYWPRPLLACFRASLLFSCRCEEGEGDKRTERKGRRK